MFDKKMLFVYNPKAGKATIRTKLADILDIFTVAGYEITIVPTQKRGDATEIISQRAGEFDIIVCSGGDGTLCESVSGMMMSPEKRPIGYIPAGSTNDFAGTLSIPNDMVKAAENIVNGHDFPCDVGLFNDRNFIYVAAFGVFSEVSYSTNQQIKNALGHSAYILSGGKSIINAHAQTMRVKSGDISVEGEFIYGMVSNSNQVGGFQGIMGEGVELNDGEFEVTLIKDPKSPQELNRILVSLLERNLDNEMMYSFKTKNVIFECEEEVPWALDGEDGGSHKRVEISTIERAVDIRVATGTEAAIRD